MQYEKDVDYCSDNMDRENLPSHLTSEMMTPLYLRYNICGVSYREEQKINTLSAYNSHYFSNKYRSTVNTFF